MTPKLELKLIEDILTADASGDHPKAVNLIFELFDSLCKAERFYQIDMIFDYYMEKKISTYIMIGLLTSTLIVKDKLRNRYHFYNWVKQSLPVESQLLVGLE